MNESQTRLKNEFRDREYREAYAEDFLNTSIATQLQVIREQRGLTQAQLAEMIGTKQAGISRIENANYSSWKIETLKKIAFALGCRLKVSIETFSSLIEETISFSRKPLERPSFEEDPVFWSAPKGRQETFLRPSAINANRNPPLKQRKTGKPEYGAYSEGIASHSSIASGYQQAPLN